MSTLLIINGYAGAGKSTVAKKFAQKNNFAYICQDEFLFQLNGWSENRELKAEEHQVAIQNMHDCILNYMHLQRDIVMEGALVSISKKDPLDINTFIKLGDRMGYMVKVVTLIADDDTRLKREKVRKWTVEENIDKRLQVAIKEANEKIDGEILIDTSTKSIKNVIKRLEEIIKI